MKNQDQNSIRKKMNFETHFGPILNPFGDPKSAQNGPKTCQDMPRQPQDRPRRAPKPKESDVFPTCKLHETHGAKMTREPYCKDPNEPGWPQSLKKAMWRRPKKGPKQAQDS